MVTRFNVFLFFPNVSYIYALLTYLLTYNISLTSVSSVKRLTRIANNDSSRDESYCQGL